MNREIKFRAWDKKEKKMLLLKMIWWNKAGEIIEFCSLSNSHTIDAREGGYEFMQYTGENDKTGKEIYEGDIVACDHRKMNYTVEWWQEEQSFAGFYPFIITEEYGGVNTFPNWVEVIGNIYENPELIGK